MWREFGGHRTLFMELPRAQEVWTRSIRIVAQCRVDVHVSSTLVIWLATESAMWFHGWNGNSPHVKVNLQCKKVHSTYMNDT